MRDINPIRSYSKNITIDERYPGYRGIKFTYAFSPLNIGQIAINCGAKIGEVLEILSEFDIRIDKSDDFEDRLDMLSYELYDFDPDDKNYEAKEISISGCTNEELISIAIFKEISKDVSKPSDLFSTIFHVKNSLGLPDDFMPSKFLNLGERAEIFSIKVLLESSYIKDLRAFYFFSPIHQGTVYPPFLVYPSLSSLNIKESQESILEKIKNSFMAFQTTNSFQNYSRYRSLKSFSKKIKMKKSGVIGSNFLTHEESEEALLSNLVVQDGGIFQFKESVSTEDLNEYVDNRRNEILNVGKEWLSLKMQ
ncbi:MAG: hypothetical protein ACYCR7_07985 [Thermoplasmataceae archaeon]